MSRRLARRSFLPIGALCALTMIIGLAFGPFWGSESPSTEAAAPTTRPEASEARSGDDSVELLPPLALVAEQAFDPCSDILVLHEGRGRPDRQGWFNHLTYQDYDRYWIACVHGWGEDQWRCNVTLWNEESGWQPTIGNRQGSGAYGIPQALPGSKMAGHGDDWRTNGRTQVRWGTRYIDSTYGTPCAALAHFYRKGWY